MQIAKLVSDTNWPKQSTPSGHEQFLNGHLRNTHLHNTTSTIGITHLLLRLSKMWANFRFQEVGNHFL